MNLQETNISKHYGAIFPDVNKSFILGIEGLSVDELTRKLEGLIKDNAPYEEIIITRRILKFKAVQDGTEKSIHQVLH